MLTRRRFLQTSAASTFLAAAPGLVRGQNLNSKLQMVAIGCDGKGWSDLKEMHDHAGVKHIGFCDVDLARTAKVKQLDPQVPIFQDYREMLADLGDKIDAATVSTPDHMHAIITLDLINRGKHVYCQKPLTHSIYEARVMEQAARYYKVQTQMGNQAHAGEPIRRGVELIRAGVIGKVSEVHAWTNRPIWPQGMTEYPKGEPVPKGLNWDLWIGPAPFREYSRAIAPFNWRGWWDFGAGALGDMGCHIMDMPYWALGLTAPSSVEAKQEGGTAVAGPHWSTITYRFPTSFFNQPVKFVWYDGVTSKEGVYQHTAPEELWKTDFPTADHVFRRFDLLLVGEKGRMFFSRARQDWVFKPETLTDGFTQPPKTIPRVPSEVIDGKGDDSGGPYVEWLNAIKTGKPALSNFASSGPFSETVLLGNLALRLGKRVEWDAKKLVAKNAPEAAAIIRRPYRKGWEMT
jgi:predicted dehydrogenase